MTRYIAIALCLLALGCEGTQHYDVDARVVSVNDNLVTGQLWGGLLSSPSGSFATDAIKVGVVAECGCYTLYMDLPLQHSELAAYCDSTTIPLHVRIIDYDASVYVCAYFSGRDVYGQWLLKQECDNDM